MTHADPEREDVPRRTRTASEIDRTIVRYSRLLVLSGLAIWGVGLVVAWRWVVLTGLGTFLFGAIVNLIRFLPIRPWRRSGSG
jgi:hypothetical protein